jgi:hypothetical protein
MLSFSNMEVVGTNLAGTPAILTSDSSWFNSDAPVKAEIFSQISPRTFPLE